MTTPTRQAIAAALDVIRELDVDKPVSLFSPERAEALDTMPVPCSGVIDTVFGSDLRVWRNETHNMHSATVLTQVERLGARNRAGRAARAAIEANGFTFCAACGFAIVEGRCGCKR